MLIVSDLYPTVKFSGSSIMIVIVFAPIPRSLVLMGTDVIPVYCIDSIEIFPLCGIVISRGSPITEVTLDMSTISSSSL